MEDVAPRQKQTSSFRRADKALFRLIGATLCIMIAIAIWVIQAEKFQELYRNYNQPYFVSYMYHSSYTFLYLLWKLWILLPGNCCCNKVGEGSLIFNKKLVAISGLLAITRIFSAYFWNRSLTLTNIPANTAIYQSAAAIVFIISVPLLKERVTFLKVFCVLLSICGVVLVSIYSTQCDKPPAMNGTSYDLYDQDLLAKTDPCAETSTPIGYVLLIISVLSYAVFETFYKKFGTVKDDPAALINGIRYAGYIGVHTLFWFWPPIFILHFSKLEVFHWPDLQQFGVILLGGVLACVFIAAIVTSIGLVSPLFATVGTILVLPASVITDWIVQGELLIWQAFLGIVFIVLGFGGFTFSEFIATRRERKKDIKVDTDTEEPSVMSRINSSFQDSVESSPLLVQSDKLSLKRRIIDSIYWI